MRNSNSEQGRGISRRLARRASVFRKRQQNQQIIELIDEHGNHSQQVLAGRRNITRHQSVLLALEARANQFSPGDKLSSLEDKLLSSTLDEAGSVDYICEETDVFSDEREQLVLREQQEIKELKENCIPDDALQIYGLFPTKKGEGIIRLVYENVNGISNRLSGKYKVEKAREIHNELEVDIAAYNKHW